MFQNNLYYIECSCSGGMATGVSIISSTHVRHIIDSDVNLYYHYHGDPDGRITVRIYKKYRSNGLLLR